MGLLLLLTIGASACQERLPPPPPPLPPLRVVDPGPPVDVVDVYVDDAKSMRGYVTSPGSRYSRVVEAFVKQLEQTGYQPSIRRFADLSASKASTVALHAVTEPKLYRARRTPLAAVLGQVATSRQTERLVVIVTDLVHTETQGVAENLRRLATVMPEVLLLGFRSAFRGPYVPEAAPRANGELPLHLDGSGERSRPFYVLVLAPSRRSLDDFRKYIVTRLDPGLSPVVQFHASERPIEWPGIKLLAEGAFGTYREVEQLPGRPWSNGFVGMFVEGAKVRGGGDRGVLRLRLSGSARLALVSPGDLGYEVARLRGTDWEPAEAQIVAESAPATADGPSGAAHIIVRYTVPPVGPNWETYRVFVRPGRANVVPPSWVSQWTTAEDRWAPGPPRARRDGVGVDNDVATHIGSRTLNLEPLVKAMLRAITERVVISEQYLRFFGREP